MLLMKIAVQQNVWNHKSHKTCIWRTIELRSRQLWELKICIVVREASFKYRTSCLKLLKQNFTSKSTFFTVLKIYLCWSYFYWKKLFVKRLYSKCFINVSLELSTYLLLMFKLILHCVTVKLSFIWLKLKRFLKEL